MNTIPELPEDGLPNLQRAIHTLPQHEPSPTAWAAIEGRLAADEALARALPTLPEHEPDDALWANIAARLDKAAPAAPPPEAAPVIAPTPEPGIVRPLWATHTVRRALALAASVLLLLGVWWQLRPTPPAAAGPRETVAYSVEEVAAPQPAPAILDPLEQEGRSFIDAHCTSLPTVCQTREFRSLRSQLTELETEQARLQQDARRFGQSPELQQQQARLTVLKASITRELVQLLIS